MLRSSRLAFFSLTLFALCSHPVHADIWDQVEHGYANSDGVKIHYATMGEGPLAIMIHGFPDFWYSWRHQMAALAEDYQVVAIDQRGYNLSDKPEGQSNYAIPHLVGDVKAVQEHFGADSSVIVGHDWGGVVSWAFAQLHPERVTQLIVLNLPHPRGLARERAHNNQQKINSAYARRFQQPGAHEALTAEGLAALHPQEVRERYVEAFNNSDFEAMLAYYKENYGEPPYLEDTSPVIKIKPPVLLFHGLEDTALLPGALNDTWEWLESDLTLVTVPGAGHWVQEDAAYFVSQMMESWLTIQRERAQ